MGGAQRAKAAPPCDVCGGVLTFRGFLTKRNASAIMPGVPTVTRATARPHRAPERQRRPSNRNLSN